MPFLFLRQFLIHSYYFYQPTNQRLPRQQTVVSLKQQGCFCHLKYKLSSESQNNHILQFNSNTKTQPRLRSLSPFFLSLIIKRDFIVFSTFQPQLLLSTVNRPRSRCSGEHLAIRSFQIRENIRWFLTSEVYVSESRRLRRRRNLEESVSVVAAKSVLFEVFGLKL